MWMPPPRKLTRWQRVCAAWMALPQFLRPALLIVAVMLFLALAGCSEFSHFRADIDILTEDANACSINPHPHPACIVGVFVYGKWHYF
jgi:hypothetical protein